MERVTEEGTIATANTLARLFNSLPSCGKPVCLVIYELHTLQNRFYLTGNCLAQLESAVPLLKVHLARLAQSGGGAAAAKGSSEAAEGAAEGGPASPLGAAGENGDAVGEASPAVGEGEAGGSPGSVAVDAVAFPDDGAAKRFGGMFPGFAIIVCGKVRDGDRRVVHVQVPSSLVP